VAKVLIDGPPATGKSTIATHTAELLRERGEPVFGFTTSEIRRGGRRTGFTVAGVASGRERVLAVRGGDGPRVGTYGVDVDAFEEIALIEIENGLELDSTLVVDEIGKMELLSPAFAQLVEKVFAAPRWLITTQRPPHPLIEPLIARTALRRIGLPRPDRAELPQIVVGWLLEEDVARYPSR
jgi:nucleoside-triphosphatase